MSFRKHGFTNLKDDQLRLNNHVQRVVEEMDEAIAIWSHNGIDARAIYAALACYHAYYYKLGHERLGADYMSCLEDQGQKLAEELLKRR